MALSAVVRAAGAVNTADQTTLTTITFPTGLAQGSGAVLCVAYDNALASPAGGDPYVSISDTAGNFWDSVANATNDPGAASDGIVVRIFRSVLQHPIVVINDSVTISFGSTVVGARAWVLYEITGASAGNSPIVLTGGANTQTATTSPTITSGTIIVGTMVMGVVAAEGNDTWTRDSDTTNGSWSNPIDHQGVGTTTAGASIGVQWKVQTTANSAQTFNPTISSARDVASAWAWILEAPFTFANAATATGTGAANDAAGSFGANGENAAGTGTAYDTTVTKAVAPNAENAAGSGEAFNATTTSAVPIGDASGTGSAYDAAILLNIPTGLASGIGAAFAGAPTTEVVTNVDAGNATGAGTANASSISTLNPIGTATGTGTAQNATADIAQPFGEAQVAAGNGSALDATIDIGTFDDLEKFVAVYSSLSGNPRYYDVNIGV